MKNYMQIECGGKLRGLKFGVMATYEAVKQLTGQDPLSFKPESTSYDDLMAYGKTIFHAGLLANCAIKKEVPDFSNEDVAEWFLPFSLTEIGQMIRMHTGEVEAKEGGEATGDTQSVVGGA